MKLWAILCRATQDRQVMVESSDKTWSTGERNGKPLQYSSLENPMSSMKRQKDRTLIDELPRFLGAQYATGDQWRNNSRKNEAAAAAKSLQFVQLFVTPWIVARQASLSTWGVSLSVSYHFAFSYCSWGSQSKNTEVACHSLLQWTTFCHHVSAPWPTHLGWPTWHGLVSLN